MLGVRASLFPGGPCVEPVCSRIIYNENNRSSGSGRRGSGEQGKRGVAEEGDPCRTKQRRCPDIGVQDMALASPGTEDDEAQWIPKYRDMERSHATACCKDPPPPPSLVVVVFFGL